MRLCLLLLPLQLCFCTTALWCRTGAGSKDVAEQCEVNSVCYRHEDRAGCESSETCAPLTTSCPAAKPTTKCCCSSEDYCNTIEKEKVAENVGGYALIIGLGVGLAFLFIIGVTAAAYCIVKKKAVDEPSYSAMESVSERSNSELSDAVTDMDTPEKTSQFRDEECPPHDLLLTCEDRSKEIVTSITSKKDKDQLIAAARSPLSLTPLYSEPLMEKPVIQKTVKFGTTNDITLSESMVHSARSMLVAGEDVRVTAANLLAEMLNHGPRQVPFDKAVLGAVLKAAADIVMAEPTLIKLPVPCVIYGDIHGQYSDMLRWFNLNGWPNKTRSIFLGDFVDRGSHGIEVVALMSCLKVLFPQNIYFCRGNHEEENLNKAYSFYDEVVLRFDEDNINNSMYEHFKRLFNHLPLAALIGERILGMHGGLSPRLNSLKDIDEIKRPIEEFENGTLATDLVWSDPDLGGPPGQYRPNLDREPKIGIGQLFSQDAVEEACKKLQVEMIIRGHQAPLHGYAIWAGGRLLTLFSAPGYKGKKLNTVNMGACIEVNCNGQLVIKQIVVTEEFRQHRIDDVEKRKKAILEMAAKKNHTV